MEHAVSHVFALQSKLGGRDSAGLQQQQQQRYVDIGGAVVRESFSGAGRRRHALWCTSSATVATRQVLETATVG